MGNIRTYSPYGEPYGSPPLGRGGRTLYIIKLSSFFSLFGDFCNSDFVEVTVTWQCTQKKFAFYACIAIFFV